MTPHDIFHRCLIPQIRRDFNHVRFKSSEASAMRNNVRLQSMSATFSCPIHSSIPVSDFTVVETIVCSSSSMAESQSQSRSPLLPGRKSEPGRSLRESDHFRSARSNSPPPNRRPRRPRRRDPFESKSMTITPSAPLKLNVMPQPAFKKGRVPAYLRFHMSIRFRRHTLLSSLSYGCGV
jgi:hypothetical protein